MNDGIHLLQQCRICKNLCRHCRLIDLSVRCKDSVSHQRYQRMIAFGSRFLDFMPDLIRQIDLTFIMLSDIF